MPHGNQSPNCVTKCDGVVSIKKIVLVTPRIIKGTFLFIEEVLFVSPTGFVSSTGRSFYVTNSNLDVPTRPSPCMLPT